jgi:hypothetical protein
MPQAIEMYIFKREIGGDDYFLVPPRPEDCAVVSNAKGEDPLLAPARPQRPFSDCRDHFPLANHAASIPASYQSSRPSPTFRV